MPAIHHVGDVPGYPAPHSPYSHAVVANGFVFVSGQIPVRPGGGPTEVVSDMSASARAGRVYRARMAWSLATRPPYPFVVVQRGPDRPLERHNREGLVQKRSPRSLPNPIVINLLGAIGGHQENLYLRPDGPDVRRELESALERHHHIRQE